ncbi:hypothetical protein BGZ65_005984 [Modicella reniformis]|uniref:Uncharacterized protein n=1 Tax=Modicella reniformis TaxID=1440133 RepID=A0A9P6LXE5_9FUNG|nr:hypothetical protein BGZ65_005984 [Modicella reniformis]
MPDDSPVRVKPGEQPDLQIPILKQSGTFTRSTSSPILLQTTPTKPTAKPPQLPQPLQLRRSEEQTSLPLPSRILTPTDGAIKSFPSHKENPFALRSVSPTKISPTSFNIRTNKAPAPPIADEAQKQKTQPDKNQPSSSNFYPVGANNNRDILRANSLAASLAKSSNNSSSSNNNNDNNSNNNNNNNNSNNNNSGTSNTSTSSSLPISNNNGRTNISTSPALPNHNTATLSTHGYRAPTPSNVQNRVILTNPHQGNGLKRPVPMGGVLDRNGSVPIKEPRLG